MFDKLPVSSETEKILTKSLDEEISVEEANHLMNIKGADFYPLLATADYLRQKGEKKKRLKAQKLQAFKPLSLQAPKLETAKPQKLRNL